MAGYTPLFSSLTTGTLYGRWPDIGLWPIVLSLADKNGVVDVTPQYLSGVTGLQIEAVIACMSRFCEPDPHSRSKAESGARLALLDSDREWGWRIVNHSRYREKARLMGKAEQERDSGKNAERMKDRRRPPKTASDHPSDADADADAEEDRRASGSYSASARHSSSPTSVGDSDNLKSCSGAEKNVARVRSIASTLAQSKRVRR